MDAPSERTLRRRAKEELQKREAAEHTAILIRLGILPSPTTPRMEAQ